MLGMDTLAYHKSGQILLVSKQDETTHLTKPWTVKNETGS